MSPISDFIALSTSCCMDCPSMVVFLFSDISGSSLFLKGLNV
jgi:hypothetical protein